MLHQRPFCSCRSLRKMIIPTPTSIITTMNGMRSPQSHWESPRRTVLSGNLFLIFDTVRVTFTKISFESFGKQKNSVILPSMVLFPVFFVFPFFPQTIGISNFAHSMASNFLTPLAVWSTKLLYLLVGLPLVTVFRVLSNPIEGWKTLAKLPKLIKTILSHNAMPGNSQLSKMNNSGFFLTTLPFCAVEEILCRFGFDKMWHMVSLNKNEERKQLTLILLPVSRTRVEMSNRIISGLDICRGYSPVVFFLGIPPYQSFTDRLQYDQERSTLPNERYE